MALSTNASSYALSNYTSSTSSSKSTSSVNASTNALSNYTSMASSLSSSSSKSTSTSVNASSNALSNYTSSTSSSSSAVNKTISAEAWNASATPSSQPTPNASSNALSNYTSTTAASSSTSAATAAPSTPTPNASSYALSNYLNQSGSSQPSGQSLNASTNALSNYIESVARIAGSAANETKNAPEQLGPGWSRDESGKLRYESDLLSQLFVPGRGPADQVATHVANGDYWQAAIAGVAWLAEDLLFVATLGGSQVRTATTKAAAAGAEKIASVANSAVPKGQVYSVAAEVKLSPSSFPGVSRRAHIQEANGQLLSAMEADPALAQRMSGLGVQLERTVTGRAPSLPPSDWTWHHAQSAGIVQLVPREQHASGSIFQGALHPNGIGGYAIWGRK